MIIIYCDRFSKFFINSRSRIKEKEACSNGSIVEVLVIITMKF